MEENYIYDPLEKAEYDDLVYYPEYYISTEEEEYYEELAKEEQLYAEYRLAEQIKFEEEESDYAESCLERLHEDYLNNLLPPAGYIAGLIYEDICEREAKWLPLLIQLNQELDEMLNGKKSVLKNFKLYAR